MAHRPFLRCPTCGRIIEFSTVAVAGKQLGDCACLDLLWILDGRAAFALVEGERVPHIAITSAEASR